MTKEDKLLRKQKEARQEVIATQIFLNPMPILNYLIDKKKEKKT